jgi:copper chaperone CopZ
MIPHATFSSYRADCYTNPGRYRPSMCGSGIHQELPAPRGYVLRSSANQIYRAIRKHHPHLAGEIPPLPETHQLTSTEAGDVRVKHLEWLVEHVKETVPTVKGALSACIQKAKKIPAHDRRLQTNCIGSDEDTEARVGRKSKTHMFFGYKQHVSMVDQDEIVTACHVTPGNADDGRQLPSLVEKNLANVPGVTELVADVAYGSKANYANLAKNDVTGYIPVNAAVYTNRSDERFTYNKDSDQMICPAGHPSYRRSRFRNHPGSSVPSSGVTYFFDPKICEACPLREGCYSGQKIGKSITVYDPYPAQPRKRPSNVSIHKKPRISIGVAERLNINSLK